MVHMADGVLQLPDGLRGIYFRVMEAADDEVMRIEYERITKELEDVKNKKNKPKK